MVTSTSSTTSASVGTTAKQNATAALLTSLGAGSGVDMASLATSLATAQYAGKTDRLSTQSDKLDRQISAASTLKSALSNLATSLGQRVRAGDLSPQPQIANASVATAILSGTTTPKGSYSLEVSSLASAQTLASPVVPSGSVGSGSIKITFGTTAGSAFTPDAGHEALEISVVAGSSLADVANAINAKGAGVSAYVSNTVDGAKLVLKGATGQANSFKVKATQAAGDPGLAQLDFDPTAPGANRLLTSAGNANFRIDGLSITSANNTVNDAIPGVNLSLTGTNAGTATTVSFSDPSSSISDAMSDLTNALNEIVSQLNTATDAKTGELSRDSGALALRRTLQQLTSKVIMPKAAEGTPRSFGDLGLSIQKDGTFLLDSARLTATLKASPQDAAAMFTNGLYGVDATISEISRNMSSISTDTKSYGATLGNSIEQMNKQKLRNTNDISILAEKQEVLRKQLVTRFSASDSQVGASKSTLSFLKNQIAAWNNSSS